MIKNDKEILYGYFGSTKLIKWLTGGTSQNITSPKRLRDNRLNEGII